jgi:hypothetical protein
VKLVDWQTVVLPVLLMEVFGILVHFLVLVSQRSSTATKTSDRRSSSICGQKCFTWLLSKVLWISRGPTIVVVEAHFKFELFELLARK